MFRKRHVCKDQIREVQSDRPEGVQPDLGEQRPIHGSLNTDIDQVKRRGRLKADQDRPGGFDPSQDKGLDDIICIVSHKSSRRFSHDNILNANDLDVEVPNPTREPYKSIYSEGKYDTLESRNPNVKLTLRMDYQHDICKDFKETGYCGFGDTCKFLHDRSDFKSGWQLDREWDKELRQKRQKIDSAIKYCHNPGDGGTSPKPSDSSSPPKKCPICKKKWSPSSDPIVTLCNHYFCEKCALNHYIRTSTCFQCGLPTKGTFNIATIPQNMISCTDTSESEDLSSEE
ncbi:Cwc24 p-like protein [Cryptosporidium canis]|uniref:Cwc24 p-like protein n=1 Tax=Cryptosporidium canis TaxID=195482 RepID=A0A9D5DMH8_9CRYT|nr:Cwc24 p-like protein [Cryptosporidium canis]